MDDAEGLELQAGWGQQLLLLRLLSMKLHEAWLGFNKHYKKYRGRGGKWRRIPRKLAGQFRSINAYLSKKDNKVEQVRNKFGAHYDLSQLRRGLSHLKESDSEHYVWITEEDHHSYFEFVNHISTLAMGSVGNKAPTKAELSRTITDVLDLSTKFLNLSRTIIVQVYKHYLDGHADAGIHEESTVDLVSVTGTRFLTDLEKRGREVMARRRKAGPKAPLSRLRYIKRPG